jgi:3-methyladenine DNA glycosylase AlkD
MAELQAKGSEKTRAMYVKHGAPAESVLGVSVADMKLIAKTIKKQQALALELFATGRFEAMYLAGIVADGAQMTRAQLQAWADSTAGMSMIAEYTVPWVTIESSAARELAMKWIASKKDHVASAGWSTYSGLVATQPDEALDLAEMEALLKSIPARIKTAPNRTRAAMNTFVISVGIYIAPMMKQATACAAAIGVVEVDVGDTACKINVATDYIAKVLASGRGGVKRKTIRC